LFVAVALFVVGLIASFSYVGPSAQSARTTSLAASCSQPRGVIRTQLSPAVFGAVTTYALPKPLRAPNSIVAAPDGSVWFGEVALRGVAHLFSNGTLFEYSWPSSFVTSKTLCFDLSELWGVALWHGMVWASDSSNDQLVGLTPSNDSFTTIPLAGGSQPRFLAVDALGGLWFTESSTHTQVGVLSSPDAVPRYFDVPAPAGEMTASILVQNVSSAYVVTVNPSNNDGSVFSFDPSAAVPSFEPVGGNQTLLAPYSAAIADGGLWVGQHDSSEVAFLNQTSSRWSFYPTSINPEVPLTLPYYLLSNGSSVWFNEHDSNKIAVITDATALTEYNVSSTPLGNPQKGGIGNVLTIGLGRDLVWFTEWTGNTVGFVNASVKPSFSISALPPVVMLAPGSSADVSLTVSGTSPLSLSLQFSDSESHTTVPTDLSFIASTQSMTGLSGTRSVTLAVRAAPSTPAGDYLVLATVTDGMTYRSVYVQVDVS
jgi:streptogramin lyase